MILELISLSSSSKRNISNYVAENLQAERAGLTWHGAVPHRTGHRLSWASVQRFRQPDAYEEKF